MRHQSYDMYMLPPRRITASSQVSRKASRPAKVFSILHASSPGGGLAAAAFGSSERGGLSGDRVKGSSEIMRPLRDGSRGACATRPPRPTGYGPTMWKAAGEAGRPV